jgi:hypothetical protein
MADDAEVICSIAKRILLEEAKGNQLSSAEIIRRTFADGDELNKAARRPRVIRLSTRMAELVGTDRTTLEEKAARLGILDEYLDLVSLQVKDDYENQVD